jgi:hypothetical protein
MYHMRRQLKFAYARRSFARRSLIMRIASGHHQMLSHKFRAWNQDTRWRLSLSEHRPVVERGWAGLGGDVAISSYPSGAQVERQAVKFDWIETRMLLQECFSSAHLSGASLYIGCTRRMHNTRSTPDMYKSCSRGVRRWLPLSLGIEDKVSPAFQKCVYRFKSGNGAIRWTVFRCGWLGWSQCLGRSVRSRTRLTSILQ